MYCSIKSQPKNSAQIVVIGIDRLCDELFLIRIEESTCLSLIQIDHYTKLVEWVEHIRLEFLI